MLKKNNLKYIFILALGFFWCSSIYLTQEQYLTKYASTNFVNNVELLFGSFSMALGILLYALLYLKKRNIKHYYFIFTLLSITSMILFFVTKNIYIMGTCLCLTCLFGTAGFGAGYHFSLLSNNILKEYRGRVFALGYGLGCIGTYLLVLLPNKYYTTYYSLLFYIPVILFNLYLVMKNGNLFKIKNEKTSTSFKTHFFRMSIIVLSMSLLSALSTDIISMQTIDIAKGFGGTRLYYCLGLITAGFLADKKNDLFEILTIVSFVFSLLVIILLNAGYSINIIAALSYFFIGFFVLYRTLSFVNISSNKNSLFWASAFGLMYSRIMEGLIVLFEDKLISNYTLLIITMSISLSIVIILYFMLYYHNNKTTENDNIRNISIKYNLSLQEEKVLNLLLKDYSNQSIADELFVSINTVRNHIANIYKKTNMKKKELREKVFYKVI